MMKMQSKAFPNPKSYIREMAINHVYILPNSYNQNCSMCRLREKHIMYAFFGYARQTKVNNNKK